MSRALQESLPDHYRLERELGRGGMAMVYLARDLKHDRLVALKVLHSELSKPLAPERFQREIRFAARLQHPHILSVHDSGEAAGHLWFAMPYVEGESLRERLRREPRLPIDDAVRIAHEVARALDYAHGQGLVHRDIKPENILLTRQGDSLVADFGIGRALGGATDEDRGGGADGTLTEVGSVIGTPAYMSLEQADGERELDGRADVYSLGVVLYEMLSGELPFAGRSAGAIVARQLTESPRPIRPAREEVSPELEGVVIRTLARDPADRFPTAGALAAGALAGGILRWRGAAPAELRPSVVAVAPFEVLDPRLALWREGLVDLLARNLDGAGPLRAIPPTVVVRRWAGRADPASAAELGRRAGAGLALYGSLLSSGRDSARLRATLLDVSDGRALGEWEVVDAADRMDRLADSLTLRLLKSLGRSRPIGAVRLAGFGRTSLPVLKAFLQGEQYFRRGEWDSALAHYDHAIELDDGFAPALRRAGSARGWKGGGLYDSVVNAYAFRAGANNHGLPQRDSLLIAADSLFYSLIGAGPFAHDADSAWTPRLRRLFAMLEYATTRYPDDPEAWFLLGDAQAHVGAYAGRSYEQQLEAFDRAIALDSAFMPSYYHVIEISGIFGADAMHRHLRPFLARAPHDLSTDGPRLVQRLLDSIPEGGDLTALLAGTSAQGVFDAAVLLARLADSAELGVKISRFIGSRSWSLEPINDTGFVKREVARALESRGHLRVAVDALQGQEHSVVFAEAALLGAVPAERAAAAFRERPPDPAFPPFLTGFAWWASQGDTASLRRAETRADSVAERDPDANGRARARYAAASAAAYRALAGADTATAVQRLLALPDGACPACYLDRLTLAQLLVERGLDPEAWQILQAEHPGSTLLPFATEVIWTLLRARVAERLGERDRAIRSYTWVAGMWRNADPELQPYVSEAREGLARLTREKP